MGVHGGDALHQKYAKRSVSYFQYWFKSLASLLYVVVKKCLFQTKSDFSSTFCIYCFLPSSDAAPGNKEPSAAVAEISSPTPTGNTGFTDDKKKYNLTQSNFCRILACAAVSCMHGRCMDNVRSLDQKL
jgi:hypothetical protein